MAYNVKAYAKVQSSYQQLYIGSRWEQIPNKPSSFVPTTHTHGNITDDGRIGTTANRVIVTSTGGLLVAKAAGTTSQFLRGDGAWATPPTVSTSSNYTWTGQHNFRGHIRFSPDTASYYFGAPEYGSGTITLPANKSGTVALIDDIPPNTGSGGLEVISTHSSGTASGTGQMLAVLEFVDFDNTKPYFIIFNGYDASGHLAHSVTRSFIGGFSGEWVRIGIGVETAFYAYGPGNGEIYMMGTSGTALRRIEAIIVGHK